jgi:hypothetical protein
MFQFTKTLATLSKLQICRRLSRLWSFYAVSLFQGNRSFEKDPLFISPFCASQGGRKDFSPGGRKDLSP